MFLDKAFSGSDVSSSYRSFKYLLSYLKDKKWNKVNGDGEVSVFCNWICSFSVESLNESDNMCFGNLKLYNYLIDLFKENGDGSLFRKSLWEKAINNDSDLRSCFSKDNESNDSSCIAVDKSICPVTSFMIDISGINEVKVLNDSEVDVYLCNLLKYKFIYRQNLQDSYIYTSSEKFDTAKPNDKFSDDDGQVICLICKGTQLNHIKDSIRPQIKDLRIKYSDNDFSTESLLFSGKFTTVRNTVAEFIGGYPCQATRAFEKVESTAVPTVSVTVDSNHDYDVAVEEIESFYSRAFKGMLKEFKYVDKNGSDADTIYVSESFNIALIETETRLLEAEDTIGDCAKKLRAKYCKVDDNICSGNLLFSGKADSVRRLVIDFLTGSGSQTNIFREITQDDHIKIENNGSDYHIKLEKSGVQVSTVDDKKARQTRRGIADYVKQSKNSKTDTYKCGDSFVYINELGHQALILSGTKLGHTDESLSYEIKKLRDMFVVDDVCTCNMCIAGDLNSILSAVSQFILGCDNDYNDTVKPVTEQKQIKSGELALQGETLSSFADALSASLSKAFFDKFTELQSLDDTRHDYKNSFREYTKDNMESLFNIVTKMPLLHTKLLDEFTKIVFKKPLYIIGTAGVGKNILEYQLIRRLCRDYSNKLHLATIDYDSSITQQDTTHSRSVMRGSMVMGLYEEAIIKANQLYFAGVVNREKKLNDDLDLLKSGELIRDMDLVVVLGNEYSRQVGDNLSKLLSFLSKRGESIVIDGELYYNTPNLIFMFNGNNKINGKYVNDEASSDDAWKSRFCVYEFSGIIYTDIENETVQTDVLDRVCEMIKDDNSKNGIELKGLLDTASAVLVDKNLIGNKIKKDDRKEFREKCEICLRDFTLEGESNDEWE